MKLTTARPRKMKSRSFPSSSVTPAMLFMPKNMAISPMTKKMMAALSMGLGQAIGVPV
jgi:hypothetical protein